MEVVEVLKDIPGVDAVLIAWETRDAGQDRLRDTGTMRGAIMTPGFWRLSLQVVGGEDGGGARLYCDSAMVQIGSLPICIESAVRRNNWPHSLAPVQCLANTYYQVLGRPR